MLGVSGLMFLAGPAEIVEGIHHLGCPDYFRRLLGFAKVLGVAALLVPLPTQTPREWAYAGFTFTLIAAICSHLASEDPPAKAMAFLLALTLLVASYLLRRRAAR
jgi:hypothetical protein